MSQKTKLVPKWMRDYNICVDCNDHHPLTGASGYMSAYVSVLHITLTEQNIIKMFKERGWTFLERRKQEWLVKLLFTKKIMS